MILEGNQRGGAKNLALHLLKEENDRVEVHELRGFVSDNLVQALNEAYAVSKGTRAQKFLFSLSLNPPAEENVSTDVFLDAIERAEDKLNLNGQPRAIVFHTKEGRRHCHAVWSRIDAAAMKAIHLSHTHRKLMDISRDLYFENKWNMPAGFVRKNERDLNNFTHAQWQQAKRTGQDARNITNALRDCWASSKTQAELRESLRQQGFVLAQGDRRAFVVLDQFCEVYAIPRWLKLKTKEVHAKIDRPQDLPGVGDVRKQIAHGMQERLLTLQSGQNHAIEHRLKEINGALTALKARQKTAWEDLAQDQTTRMNLETTERQARYNKGLRGILDRLTGRHGKIRQQNELEYAASLKRDQREKDELTFIQLKESRSLRGRVKRLDVFQQNRGQAYAYDIGQYREIERGQREKIELVSDKTRRRPSLER